MLTVKGGKYLFRIDSAEFVGRDLVQKVTILRAPNPDAVGKQAEFRQRALLPKEREDRPGLRYAAGPHCNRHPRSAGDNRASGCDRADALARKIGHPGAVHCHAVPNLHVRESCWNRVAWCKHCRPSRKRKSK